ncbi:MAG TPA: glycosyltransferase family 2 protein [Ignavibacteria bacterium]|nr:glycosyltransferase family 2 protein [Ignavibacteria bacterium]HMR38814.1 glycosyltransferase family 2 protein [Ignavibacteria bacterium]
MNNTERPVSISIVSPVYKSEKIVDELVKRLSEELSRITGDFEIVLPEDGSGDGTWEKVEENCKKYDFVKGVKLSRNFGQHYAITAGLSQASGDIIVIMDCDLQDDPAHIKKLFDEFNKGYDVVFTKRIGRKHSFFKKITAKIYNTLFSLFSNKDYDLDVGSMTMISRRVKDEFLKLKDQDRLYIQLLKWVGFSSTYVPVEHRERFEGTSTYSVSKLFLTALQGWTSYSDKLLRLSIYTGLVISILSFLASLFIAVSYFLLKYQPGWPSIIVAILFSTGLILMSIGIAGIYIGKIFEQTKDRPLYIIEKKINL